MSNKNKKLTAQTPVTPVQEEVTVVSDSDIELVDAAETGLAVAPVRIPLPVWMDRIPKAFKHTILQYEEVTTDELEGKMANLDKASSVALQDVFDRMNPQKPGMMVAETAMRVKRAKIYHGMGNDPMRPAAAPAGTIHADDKILCIADKMAAKVNKVGQTFEAALLFVTEHRVYVMPEDKTKAPPGVPPETFIICRSPDRKLGTRYGDCEACPNRPFAPGSKEKRCENKVTLYLLLRGFSEIIQLEIKSTSFKTGYYPLKKRVDNLTAPYNVWFEFGLAAQEADGKKWYALTVQPTVDAVTNGAIETTPAEREICNVLMRQILHESFVPSLKYVYDREATEQSDGTQADMAALMGTQAGETKPASPMDFSDNNPM